MYSRYPGKPIRATPTTPKELRRIRAPLRNSFGVGNPLLSHTQGSVSTRNPGLCYVTPLALDAPYVEEFGRAIGALCRTLKTLGPADALTLLTTKHALEPGAAASLLSYLDEQQEITGSIPDDKSILIEYTRDELGDWRICTKGFNCM